MLNKRYRILEQSTHTNPYFKTQENKSEVVNRSLSYHSIVEVNKNIGIFTNTYIIEPFNILSIPNATFIFLYSYEYILRTVLVILIFWGSPKTADKNGSSVPFLESFCAQHTLNQRFYFFAVNGRAYDKAGVDVKWP